VPTVVLTGGEDRLTPAAHGRAIAEAIPDTELIEVAGAGHLLPLEYPGIVTAAIRRLICRAGSSGRPSVAPPTEAETTEAETVAQALAHARTAS
jgi:hypothetical protein